MSKVLWNSLLISPALLGAVLAGSASAIAAETQSVSTDSASLQTLQIQAPVNQLVAPTVAPEATATSVASAFSAKSPEASAPTQVNSPAVTQAQPSLLAQTQVQEPASATEVNTDSLNQINRYSREGNANRNTIGQVTSVSQLSDVQPTDWAFQALQSLVERYGCIAGYPDGTYKGNRAMTRYEFAAGLNACLDRVNELIAAGTTGLATKEDLATLQKLQEEFAAELATLRGRVDALEARTTELEANQFSTTTKLAGEVIFAVTDEFAQPIDNETVFQDRVRLTLNTSFTGKDLLVTRLAAGNAGLFNTESGGPEGIQTFNFGNTGNNDIVADWVAYYFPLGDNIQVYIPVVSGLQYDYAPTLSPALDAFDGGTGPLSIFAQRNPIYLIGGGSGIGTTVSLGALKFSVGYLADNSDPANVPVTFGANVPSEKNGLFNGSYSALAQVALTGDAFGVGLTYVNAYRRGALFDGGSAVASSGTLAANGLVDLGTGDSIAQEANAFGLSGYLKLGSGIVLNAFGTYVDVDYKGIGSDENGEVWTYGAGIAFPDFGKKGNLLGFTAGVEPYLGNPREVTSNVSSNDIPLHFEGFYKFQFNDNISITPGVIWIVNPGQNEDNSDIVIGTVRTTFTF